MIVYQDLTSGDVIRAGDECFSASIGEWRPATAGIIGVRAVDTTLQLRRPVEVVPKEQHDNLRQQLAEAHALTMEAMKGAQQVNEELTHLRQTVERLKYQNGILQAKLDAKDSPQ